MFKDNVGTIEKIFTLVNKLYYFMMISSKCMGLGIKYFVKHQVLSNFNFAHVTDKTPLNDLSSSIG